MEAGAIAFKWHWKGTKHMTPESQTLFSITLFLALSSLLAWSNRRHRGIVRWAKPYSGYRWYAGTERQRASDS
jgi:hypothetical protein